MQETWCKEGQHGESLLSLLTCMRVELPRVTIIGVPVRGTDHLRVDLRHTARWDHHRKGPATCERSPAANWRDSVNWCAYS